MTTDRSDAGALLLTATLSTPVESRFILESHLTPPAVIRESHDYRPPLDLNATTFRYEVVEGRLRVAVREPIVETCRSMTRHLHRRC